MYMNYRYGKQYMFVKNLLMKIAVLQNKNIHWFKYVLYIIFFCNSSVYEKVKNI